MKKPSAVIFDLGDTVLRVESYDWIAANKKLLEFTENDTNLTPEEIQRVAFEINTDFEQHRINAMIEIDTPSFYRTLFETVGLSLSISHEEAARVAWHTACKFCPEEGIYEALDILEKHNIRKGILSNGSFSGTILEEELAKYHLAHRFEFVISSADYVVRKPHCRIFNLAVKKMNLAPKDIWFVGDKLDIDIKGAINAGIYPVWYNSQNKPADPDYDCLEVKTWHEFKDIIESLYSD